MGNTAISPRTANTRVARTDRFEARISQAQKALFAQAAAHRGLSSMSEFVITAAVTEARKVLQREHLIELAGADAHALLQAIRNPGKPAAKARRAATGYLARSKA